MRTSQPYGWNRSANGSIKHFYCASHDYDYYPQEWTASDGTHFEEGFYDENGQHYDNVVMIGGTTMLKCEYCGSRMVYKWQEGSVPICDKCGAQFSIDITDKKNSNTGRKSASAQKPMIGKIAIAVFVLCLSMPVFALAIGLFSGVIPSGSSEGTRFKTEAVKNSVYVEEIGRTCYLDGEDWYDSKTQCWFYYNNTVSPYQWQYWYEGISSNYGDYGWMEYDMGEEAWYIETNDGNWVHLPESYDTTDLWHMTDEYVNAYE
jgi:DNA-directed RNA polymerase subunit M/transcription elongation factor TFIIS